MRARRSTPKPATTTQRAANPRLVQIARTVLNVPTLQQRNSDSLDFHQVGVWQIRQALELAFAAGAESAGASKPQPKPRRYVWKDTLGNTFTLYVRPAGQVCVMNQHRLEVNPATVAGAIDDGRLGTDALAERVRQVARGGLEKLRQDTSLDWSEVE